MSPKDKQMTRLQAASVVAKVVELESVRVTKLSAKHLVRLEETFDRECTLVTESGSSYKYDEKAARLDVEIPIRVAIHESLKDETTKPAQDPTIGRAMLRVKATLSLSYKLTATTPPPEELRETLFSAFAAINGTYNAWPYFRELVQSTTARMGLPGVMIPVFRVPRQEDEMGGTSAATPKLKLVAGSGRE